MNREHIILTNRMFFVLELLLFGGEITSQIWHQKIKNMLLVISCIHLEEQTKGILNLKSVSKYNHSLRKYNDLNF
jgi:hypothetical protein